MILRPDVESKSGHKKGPRMTGSPLSNPCQQTAGHGQTLGGVALDPTHWWRFKERSGQLGFCFRGWEERGFLGDSVHEALSPLNERLPHAVGYSGGRGGGGHYAPSGPPLWLCSGEWALGMGRLERSAAPRRTRYRVPTRVDTGGGSQAEGVGQCQSAHLQRPRRPKGGSTKPPNPRYPNGIRGHIHIRTVQAQRGSPHCVRGACRRPTQRLDAIFRFGVAIPRHQCSKLGKSLRQRAVWGSLIVACTQKQLPRNDPTT